MFTVDKVISAIVKQVQDDVILHFKIYIYTFDRSKT